MSSGAHNVIDWCSAMWLWLRKLTRLRFSDLKTLQIGGFAWWKALGLVVVGLIMAWAMSLRYGDPSRAWLTVLAVLAFSVCLLWWSHVRLRDDGRREPTDEDQRNPPA